MERAAWVALSAVSGLGPVRFRRLLEEFGSALAALEAGPDEILARADLPESLASQLAEVPSHLEEMEADLLALDEQGLRPLIWPDPDYPSRLLSTSSAPPVLWWFGRIDLNRTPGMAVIGSRQASEEGLAWARAAAAKLVEAGLVVISGLAAGIDAAAHEATLEANGLTVGVCGCGLLTALNQGQGGLAGQVAEAGALCSELSPTAPLLPQALFARDRIIAGLAQAVIVIEARPEGGAVHTAKCALQEGRKVFAVKWPQDHPSRGTADLLAQGARPLASPDDVLSVGQELASCPEES
jgi:DNA processing protein